MFLRVSSGSASVSYALPAGTYTFFAVPGEAEWTLIFNRVPRQWGAFSYDSKKDVLRVKARPQPAPENQEWLMYTFDPVTAADHAAESAMRAPSRAAISTASGSAIWPLPACRTRWIESSAESGSRRSSTAFPLVDPQFGLVSSSSFRASARINARRGPRRPARDESESRNSDVESRGLTGQNG